MSEKVQHFGNLDPYGVLIERVRAGEATDEEILEAIENNPRLAERIYEAEVGDGSFPDAA